MRPSEIANTVTTEGFESLVNKLGDKADSFLEHVNTDFDISQPGTILTGMLNKELGSKVKEADKNVEQGTQKKWSK